MLCSFLSIVQLLHAFTLSKVNRILDYSMIFPILCSSGPDKNENTAPLSQHINSGKEKDGMRENSLIYCYRPATLMGLRAFWAERTHICVFRFVSGGPQGIADFFSRAAVRFQPGIWRVNMTKNMEARGCSITPSTRFSIANAKDVSGMTETGSRTLKNCEQLKTTLPAK